MHILVVNPNTTKSMTDKIGAAARKAASFGTLITALTSRRGPSAIQGREDGANALPGLYEVINETLDADPTIDALVIACFDDTGLWELKARLAIPVLGVGEAGYIVAAVLAHRFSVVTTLSVSIPVLEENLQRQGLFERCARVRASEVPVLDLEDPASDARSKIEAEIAAALAEDDIGALVLGCAGMADLADELTKTFGLPVIDGVAAAVRLAEALGPADVGPEMDLRSQKLGG
ncbi:MAG: aspartate/glutamate racemase family protein [Rhodobacteraceae bacterium]|nr:aspartate/glutamate racemase family protein [Paracoccaceae bacterium]